MKSRGPLLVPFLLAALAACAAPQPVIVPSQDGAGDTCGLAALSDLLGQPASVLDTMRFAQPIRVIRPDDAVTEDFSPERLNVHLDERDRVESLSCG